MLNYDYLVFSFFWYQEEKELGNYLGYPVADKQIDFKTIAKTYDLEIEKLNTSGTNIELCVDTLFDLPFQDTGPDCSRDKWREYFEPAFWEGNFTLAIFPLNTENKVNAALKQYLSLESGKVQPNIEETEEFLRNFNYDLLAPPED
ncbi:hypothetical protein [Pseudomonas sp. RIT-To-2]|uniref:hypothetical protein n=1 Tax=Pseudomonas sp. RIT-To-2 TaxID=3462541 RepID=UPI002412E9F3